MLTVILASAVMIGTSADVHVWPTDTLSSRLEEFSGKLPMALSRFCDYPPGPGVLGFPRCLFENPFKPNVDFWLKQVDFSCVSPWNDTHGHLRAGTAISKRHIILAKHFPLSKGTRIAFVGETGETSHYTIAATKASGNCDIMIGLLDYELTPDVHPAKVLPVGFQKHIAIGSKWPVVTFNQREQALLSELSCVSNRETGGVTLRNNTPTDMTWRRFGGMIISGDSGDPAFLLYRGHPILLYCLSAGGAGFGPLIHERRGHIQQLMDDLCPGYPLEQFDFESAGMSD